MNRLLTTLSNLVANNHLIFLKGWRIFDAINLAQEFTHAFNNIGTSMRDFIRIDFNKVFDTMNFFDTW